jgi:copper(I)-binding protein
MRRLVLLVLFAAILGACESDREPMLSVENVRVFAPLPGRSESVAYLDLHNPGDSAVSLVGVSSNDFASAEIHATSVEGGIARMEMLSAVNIDANSSLVFAPGAMHIMLLEPRRALLPGAKVQIELRFDNGSVLLLDAPVLTRMGTQDQ